MRSMTMRGLVLAASMLAGPAHAGLGLNTSLDCGQSLILDTPSSSTQRLACSGDFTISGGSIVFDETLVIYAGGNLTLSNVLLKGPALVIYSPGGNITIGTDVTIDSPGPVTVDTVSVQQRPSFPLPFPDAIEISTAGQVVFNQPSASGTISVAPRSDIGLTPSAVGVDTNGHVYLSNPGRIQLSVNGTLEIAGAQITGEPSIEFHAGLVPEPSFWALMAAGMTTLLFARRRRG